MQQQMQRRGFVIGLLLLGVLAGAALTANPAQAVDAPGPYYAEPAWDQIKGAAGRFVVLTNWNSAAVMDKETGLVWERTPGAVLTTWSNARIACAARTTGNRKGWRLPSVHELASLVHPSVNPGPTLQTNHPFLGVQSVFYWSATTNVVTPTEAWDVDFANGAVVTGSKAADDFVWCVRGGMNADAY